MPLIVPRKNFFGEAVSDHQLYFADYIKGLLPKKYKKYVIMDDHVSTLVYKFLLGKTDKNILKYYLFPNFTRSFLKKSFKKLLLRKKIF